MYALDALDAYNQRLVKRIEVKGFELNNMRVTDGYLYLQDIIVSKNKAPQARIEYKKLSASGKVVTTSGLFDEGDDIYTSSGELEAYRDGWRIAPDGIVPDGLELGQTGYVRFMNGETLGKGQILNDGSETDMRRIQIRETILSHIERERQLFHKGIKVLSLYVFSTENFARDAKEVGYLMDLFANNFRTIAEEMNERDCQVLFSGRREGLQQRVLDAMDYMMDLTKDNKTCIVNFCLNYGSHAELTDAMRAIAGEVQNGTLAPADINEQTIESHLYRQLPPVDFMIRTSGEERLSNFLLWQCAYAEFYFTPTLFPDFTKECFDKALAEYARRDRRMGGNTKK